MNMNCPACGEAVSYIYSKGDPNTLGACMKKACGKKWAWRIWEVVDGQLGEAAEKYLLGMGEPVSMDYKCINCNNPIEFSGYCSFGCREAVQPTQKFLANNPEFDKQKNEPPVEEVHHSDCECWKCSPGWDAS